MSAGAVVAIMAAARAQRLQKVRDAFRLADATAPARARTRVELHVTHLFEAEEPARSGVIAGIAWRRARAATTGSG